MRRFGLAWLAVGLGVTAVAAPDEAPPPDGWGEAAEVRPARRRRAARARLAKPESPAAALADRRLRTGAPILAATVARQCLDAQPDDLDCVDVLGRALAAVGRCDKALPHLERVRREGAWTPKAAFAEGVCHVRSEDFETALVAFDEAAWFDPRDASAWLQRGLVNARLGRLDALDRDLDRAVEVSEGGYAPDLLHTWRAYVTDDPGLDAWLHHFGRYDVAQADPVLVQHVSLVDCHRWLDLGDPVAAAEVARRGLEVSRGHTRLQACRGEALRRTGEAELAERYVHRPYQSGSDAPLLDVVRVRALADLGRLDEADAVLDGFARRDDPEVVASAWYVARARGDVDAQERLEAVHRRVRVAGHPELRRLVPVPEVP